MIYVLYREGFTSPLREGGSVASQRLAKPGLKQEYLPPSECWECGNEDPRSRNAAFFVSASTSQDWHATSPLFLDQLFFATFLLAVPPSHNMPRLQAALLEALHREPAGWLGDQRSRRHSH